MKLDDLRRSTNIEDRRGNSGNTGGGFGGGGLPIRTGGGLGFIIVVLLMLFFGGGNNLLSSLGSSDSGGQYSSNGYQAGTTNGNGATNNRTKEEAETYDRLAAVLGSSEDFWADYFKKNGETYRPPTLVVFDGRTSSSCGTASESTGPFYCPTDRKVFLDMSFFKEMRTSLGAGGDFAEAYVVAHEIGHSVQDQLGILSKTNRAMARSGENKGAVSLAVRVELQADCLAGAWAKVAIADKGNLEQGDVEEAINASQSVGDDRLQKRAQGYAVPDSFTHGTSEQRARWFAKGMQSGNPDVCDTFSTSKL